MTEVKRIPYSSYFKPALKFAIFDIQKPGLYMEFNGTEYTKSGYSSEYGVYKNDVKITSHPW